MGLVIDTSALIALERAGSADLGSLPDEPAAVPAIVYAEVLVGVRMARSAARASARRARLEALVERAPIVEFDRAIAERWAELFAEFGARGVAVPSNDLAVAASAQTLGYGVLIGPRGERHLERIPEMRVVRLKL